MYAHENSTKLFGRGLKSGKTILEWVLRRCLTILAGKVDALRKRRQNRRTRIMTKLQEPPGAPNAILLGTRL
jgi:hypothetical protein